MIGVSWNVRGLGNPHNFRALKKFLQEKDPDLVFLMETKKSKIEMADICFNIGFGGCCVVEKMGRSSGGLAMCWKKDMDVRTVGFSTGHIDVEVRLEAGLIRVTGFYGNLDTNNRGASWELL